MKDANSKRENPAYAGQPLSWREGDRGLNQGRPDGRPWIDEGRWR